jgi:tetratricopeptide (TPR) repeat protein
MMKLVASTVLCLLLSAAQTVSACTMVMVADEDTALAGNNEDWQDPDTWMWFVPPTSDEYGRVCFGFGDGYVQGGMNDQGLFIDGNALAETGWVPDPDKPDFTGNIMDHILAHCATVDDVAAFFRTHNTAALARAKFPIADATGDAAVVEWGQGGLQILKRTGRYQISTNFVQSNHKPDDYPCDRYRIAEKILGATDGATVDVVRAVLSAVHNEYPYPTVYSNIYDLRKKKIYLYNFHNFEDVVVLDLDAELRQGPRKIEIPSLFEFTTHAAILFERIRTRPAAEELRAIINEDGVEAAITRFHEMKGEYREVHRFDISEREINRLGYLLLGSQQHAAAVAIFELNLAEHPESWNVYDSLAEALAAQGEVPSAIDNYRRSLELNPANQNATNWLARLEKETRVEKDDRSTAAD